MLRQSALRLAHRSRIPNSVYGDGHDNNNNSTRMTLSSSVFAAPPPPPPLETPDQKSELVVVKSEPPDVHIYHADDFLFSMFDSLHLTGNSSGSGGSSNGTSSAATRTTMDGFVPANHPAWTFAPKLSSSSHTPKTTPKGTPTSSIKASGGTSESGNSSKRKRPRESTFAKASTRQLDYLTASVNLNTSHNVAISNEFTYNLEPGKLKPYEFADTMVRVPTEPETATEFYRDHLKQLKQVVKVHSAVRGRGRPSTATKPQTNEYRSTFVIPGICCPECKSREVIPFCHAHTEGGKKAFLYMNGGREKHGSHQLVTAYCTCKYPNVKGKVVDYHRDILNKINGDNNKTIVSANKSTKSKSKAKAKSKEEKEKKSDAGSAKTTTKKSPMTLLSPRIEELTKQTKALSLKSSSSSSSSSPVLPLASAAASEVVVVGEEMKKNFKCHRKLANGVQCAQSFMSQAALDNHHLSLHSTDYHNVCDICSEICKGPNELKFHNARMHPSSKHKS